MLRGLREALMITRNNLIKANTMVCGLLMVLLAKTDLSAMELSGSIDADIQLKKSDSPIIVNSNLLIPDGRLLEIDAGVEFQMATGVCITVDGRIIANGSKFVPIRFSGLDGAHWGNIKILGNKEIASYDADNQFLEESGGSYLNYCEFTSGGNVTDENYDGGAVYLSGTSPLISNCTFKSNKSERAGAIVCYEFSSPLIRACTFEENEATIDDGGAIFCYFYSDAKISRNFIVRNKANRNGGGLYISNSSPIVQENALIDNYSGARGGAIFASSSSPEILDNAIYENFADMDESNGIVFQSDCRPEVKGNSLMAGKAEIYGLNLSYNLDLSDNWWGTTVESTIISKVRQYGRVKEKRLSTRPWLDKPVGNLLTQPIDIKSIQAMTDDSWQDSLAFDLVVGIAARIQISAIDRNPYAIDQTSAEVVVLQRPSERFTLIFRETAKASGIFQANFMVAGESLDIPVLHVNPGESILLTSSADERISRLYDVDEARPVIYDLAIDSDQDPTHVIKHKLEVAWSYFDLRGESQQSWQMQVAHDSTFRNIDQWDSGEMNAGENLRKALYAGDLLKDGSQYFFRLRVKGGMSWSAWKIFMVRNDNPEYSFRMNSLPEIPELLAPVPGIILPVFRPEFSVGEVFDPEGDSVHYEFQIAEDEHFIKVVSSSDYKTQSGTIWTPQEMLLDNGNYWWRVRVWDGFEFCEWSRGQQFFLNPVEENPGAFTLLGPNGQIADVLPRFNWTMAVDPDPGSSVSYTFRIGRKQDLSESERIPGLAVQEYQKQAEIPNLSDLYWAVFAVDNTGLSTRSTDVFNIYVDTTPTVPLAIFPESDNEIMAFEAFKIEESIDPWPQDALKYEIQISADGSFAVPFISWQGLAYEDVRDTPLENYLNNTKMHDDTRYFWRVRASDNHRVNSDWSRTVSFVFNRRNNAPSIPPGKYTPLPAEVVSEKLKISWMASSDSDITDTALNMSYRLQMSMDQSFSAQVLEKVIKNKTDLDASTILADNNQWFWRVKAVDNENAQSEWSPTQNFIYNKMEEAPAYFSVINPGNSAKLFALNSIDIAWNSSSDPDWDSSITYKWEIASDLSFTKIVKTGSLRDTKITTDIIFNSRQDYWLQLSAIDNTGLITKAAVVPFRVDSHPSVPMLNLTAAEINPQTKLSWQAAVDPDPNDKILYRIKLFDVDDRSLVDVKDIPGTSITVGKLFGANKLPDDVELSWLIIATDDNGLNSQSAKGSFWYNRSNDAPTAAAFSSSLTEGQVWTRLDPILPFSGATDSDFSDTNESLSFKAEFADNADFLKSRFVQIEAGSERIEGVVLADNSHWFVRLRSLDDEGAISLWSNTLGFIVNTKEDPPSAPQIVSPVNGADLFDLSALDINCNVSTDIDVNSSVKYLFELLQKGQVIQSRESAQPVIHWDYEFSNATVYQLRVRAIDNTGLESQPLEHRFTVDTTPGDTQLNSQLADIMSNADAITWDAARDPDPNDKLSYEVEVSRGQSFDNAAKITSAANSVAVSKLASKMVENEEAWIRVRARDTHGITGSWSRERSFYFDNVNDAPVWNGKISPAPGLIKSNQPTMNWELPTDPDVKPQNLIVQIEIAGDKNFNQVLASKKFAAKALKGQVKLKENQQRWVRARALDQGGASSSWSAVNHYVVNARSEEPTKAVLVSPAQNHNAKSVGLFKWKASHDPDPGAKLKYRLEITPANGIPYSDVIEGTEKRNDFKLPGKYSWRVVTIDENGLEAVSTDRQFTIPEPPPPPPVKEDAN
jgi:hypothetical protein